GRPRELAALLRELQAGEILIRGRPRSYWQTQTVWYIEPDGTNGGSDGNAGEEFTASCLIYPLSGSTNDDDGDISGFSTPSDSTRFIAIVGTATVLDGGTGTLTGALTRSGNGKQTITDSSQAWATNGL